MCLPSSLPHSPFLTLATLSGRAAIAFPHTQWKWQCHQLDATPNSLYKLSWAGTISVARSRWLIEAQASRWLLGEKWSISQQEEWAGEGKQALREQKLHWCERAAQLPAAGASLNIHISNNLELYVVQTGRVTSRWVHKTFGARGSTQTQCPRKTMEKSCVTASGKQMLLIAHTSKPSP